MEKLTEIVHTFEAFEDFDSVHAWHDEIENYDVYFSHTLAEYFECALAISSGDYGVSHSLEIELKGASDEPLVVGDQEFDHDYTPYVYPFVEVTLYWHSPANDCRREVQSTRVEWDTAA